MLSPFGFILSSPFKDPFNLPYGSGIFLKFLAAYYDDSNYEMLPIVKGVLPAGHAHSADILLPDYEGVYRKFLDGECIWQDGRVVRNELEWSEDFSTAAWGTSNATLTNGAIDPNGGVTAGTITATVSNGYALQNYVSIIGHNYNSSVYLKRRVGGSNIQIYNGESWITVTVAATWKRFAVNTVENNTISNFGVRLTVSGDAVDIAFVMKQDKTGASDPTIPDEYIPTQDAAAQKVFADTNPHIVTNNIVTVGTSSALDPVPRQVSQQYAQNEIEESWDLTTGWTAGNNLIITCDQVGLTGEANMASHLNDNSDTSAGFASITGGVSTPDDDSPVTLKWYIDKQADNAAFPQFRLRLQGGTTELSLFIRISKFSGDTYLVSSVGTVAYEVVDDGNRWKVLLQVTNNTTGNTLVNLFCYVADCATIDGSSSATPTGTLTTGNVEVHLNKTIAQVKNLGPIFTSGAPDFTDAVLNTIPAANISNNECAGNFSVKTDGSQMIFGGFISYGLGSELVVDGSFDTACGVNWVCKSVDNTIVDGVGRCTNSESIKGFIQNNVFIVGKTYFMQFDVVEYTAGLLNLTDGGTSLVVGGGVGRYHGVKKAGATTLWMMTMAGLATLDIDNVSVRRLGMNTNFQLTDIEGNTCQMPGIDGVNNDVAWNLSASKSIMSITVNGSKSADVTYCGQLIPESEETIKWFMDQQFPATNSKLEVWWSGTYDERQAKIEEAQA